jgi:hypothetical protein
MAHQRCPWRLLSVTNLKGLTMRKLYQYGGIAASIMLIALGIGAVVAGFVGRDQVRTELAREGIVGTPDMKGVANQKVDTGGEARDFAAGMREHTLAATGGKTYAEMPRFAGKNGEPTNDEKLAAVDPKSGAPVDNPARQIWVTETSLTTALSTAYFAENVALFSIVMGFALLLTGVGFGVVTMRLLMREPSAATRTKVPAPTPVVAS